VIFYLIRHEDVRQVRNLHFSPLLSFLFLIPLWFYLKNRSAFPALQPPVQFREWHWLCFFLPVLLLPNGFPLFPSQIPKRKSVRQNEWQAQSRPKSWSQFPLPCRLCLQIKCWNKKRRLPVYE